MARGKQTRRGGLECEMIFFFFRKFAASQQFLYVNRLQARKRPSYCLLDGECSTRHFKSKLKTDVVGERQESFFFKTRKCGGYGIFVLCDHDGTSGGGRGDL